MAGRGVAARLRGRWLTGACVGVAGFVLTALPWRAGTWEPLEHALRDAWLREHVRQASGPARVTIVEIGETDIERFGHPLPDGILADAIERIARAGARAVGIDVYRDRPVGDGAERLAGVTQANPHVVWVHKLPDADGPRVSPPPFVRSDERLGFSDVVSDHDGVVRRGLLFLWETEERAHLSLALRLATLHAGEEGVSLGADADRDGAIRFGSVTLPPLEGDDGGYVGADAGGYQILLEYPRGRAGIPALPLADLLEGRADPERLRGRTVLLGTCAPSVKDDFLTPLGRGGATTCGVEVHAQAVEQLLAAGLDGAAPPRFLGEGAEAALLLAAALAAALAGLGVRGLLGFSALMLGAPALPLALGIAALRAGWWIPAVAPAAAAIAAGGVAVALVAARARAEQAAIMQLFGRFVSRSVAARIWEQRDDFLQDGRPRPQRQVVTVLMTDLAGYTAAAEKLDPAVLMAWINEYMEAMAELVESHGGIVDDYAGDGLKADFGVPVARAGEGEIRAEARAALRCALAMREAFAGLTERWTRGGLPQAKLRVGIATGPVVVGSLGSARRLKYTTMGDTVNVASRLENLRDPAVEFDDTPGSCRILVAEETWRLAEEAFSMECAGSFRLKGRDETSRVYRVLPSAGTDAVPAGREPG